MTRRRMEPGERGEIFYEPLRGGWRAMQYFRDYAGKRRRAKGHGATKTAARRALTKNVNDALAVGGAGYSPKTRFQVAVTEYLQLVRHAVEDGRRSATTWEAYDRNARVHVLPALGHLRIAELSTGRLDTFLYELHQTAGYSTAKMARTVLNGTFGLLKRRDVLRTDPMAGVGRIERRNPKRAPRALSVAEAHALLDLFDNSPYAVRKDLPDLMRFLLATGVRIGEALAVRWADVDLEAGLVLVEATVIRVKGKGLVRKATKSDASERTLRLPGWCVGMLARRFHNQPLDAPVFPDSLGGWRDRNNTGRDIRRVRAGTGYEWVTSHTARRTVATLLDIDGMTARAIADQLGHARPSMTQDVYMGRRVIAADTTAPLNALWRPEDDHAEGGESA